MFSNFCRYPELSHVFVSHVDEAKYNLDLVSPNRLVAFVGKDAGWSNWRSELSEDSSHRSGRTVYKGDHMDHKLFSVLVIWKPPFVGLSNVTTEERPADMGRSVRQHGFWWSNIEQIAAKLQPCSLPTSTTPHDSNKMDEWRLKHIDPCDAAASATILSLHPNIPEHHERDHRTAIDVTEPHCSLGTTI